MSGVDELVESLLYEGYALYPYTPGSAKNATPTPFGIVYPPAYAETISAAHDHLRVECGLVPAADSQPSAVVRFLQTSGEGHEAVERRIELPAPGEAVEFTFEGLSGRARLRVEPERAGAARLRVCVHNTTPIESGDIGRGEALRSSFISTHVVVTAPGDRFLSPAEHPQYESVNTFPVLATAEDDTVIGAAIVLPDHPKVAPQSRGSLFDGTEIEEALLLHVHTLSDMERDAIAEGDPAVAAMVERAAAATPQDLIDLHGVMHPTREHPTQPLDPPWRPAARAEGRPDEQTEPPEPPALLPDQSGAAEVTVGRNTFHRGGKVRLNPKQGGDAHDLLLVGRTATIERILRDVDDRLYFGVTVDGDPGQELLRDTGRFRYFFDEEVEPA